MIAGVPGAGISAFFYLICVALMPFVAAWRMVRGGTPRWRLVARQLAIGVGILAGLVAGGAMVTAVALSAAAPAVQPGQVGSVALDIGMTLGRIGVFLGLGTLVLVLGSVQLFALVEGRRHRRQPGQLVPVAVRSNTGDFTDLWSTARPSRRPDTD